MNINSQLTYKGEINIQVIRDNKIINEINVSNLFLDEGAKSLSFSDSTSVNLFLHYQVPPPSLLYTGVSFSSLLVNTSIATITPEYQYSRVRFTTGLISPSSSTRTFNIVGLLKSGGGSTNVYCCTILNQNLVQYNTDYLIINYYIYVNEILGGNVNFNSDLKKEILYKKPSLSSYNIHLPFKNDKLNFIYHKTASTYTLISNYSNFGYSFFENISSPTNLSIGQRGWYAGKTIGYFNNTTSKYENFNVLHINNNPQVGRIFLKKKTSTSLYFENDFNKIGTSYPFGVDVKLPSQINDLKDDYSYYQIHMLNDGNVGNAKYFVVDKCEFRSNNYYPFPIYYLSNSERTANNISTSAVPQYLPVYISSPLKINGIDFYLINSGVYYPTLSSSTYYISITTSLFNPEYGFIELFRTMTSSPSLSLDSNIITFVVTDNKSGYENDLFLFYRMPQSASISSLPNINNMRTYLLWFKLANLNDFSSFYLYKSKEMPSISSFFVSFIKNNYLYIYLPSSSSLGIKLNLNNFDNSDFENIPSVYTFNKNSSLPIYYDNETNTLFYFYNCNLFKLNLDEINHTQQVSNFNLNLSRGDSFDYYNFPSSDYFSIENNKYKMGIGVTYVYPYIFGCYADLGSSPFTVTAKFSEISALINQPNKNNGIGLKCISSSLLDMGGIYIVHYSNSLYICNSSKSSAVSIPNNTTEIWFKATRNTGNTLTFSYSTNGTNYNDLYFVSLGSSFVYIGASPFANSSTLQSYEMVYLDEFKIVNGEIRNPLKFKTNYVINNIIPSNPSDSINTNIYYFKNQSTNKEYLITRPDILEKDDYGSFSIKKVTLNYSSGKGATIISPDKKFIMFFHFLSGGERFTIYSFEEDKFFPLNRTFGDLSFLPFYYNGYIYFRDASSFNAMKHFIYDWDNINQRWKIVDMCVDSYSILNFNGKTTHSSFEPLPGGLLIKFINNPNNQTTFYSTDMYTVDYCKYGIIVDNMQYVKNAGFRLYLTNFAEKNEIVNIPSSPGENNNVDVYLSAKNDPNFASIDTSNYLLFYVLDTNNNFIHTSDVFQELNVTSVDTTNPQKTKIYFNYNPSTIPANNYNFYVNYYVKFTSGNNLNSTRKILEYDFHSKMIVTEPFSNSILQNDKFNIVIPTELEQISYSSNISFTHFAVKFEKDALISLSSSHCGKKLLAKYVAIYRTW